MKKLKVLLVLLFVGVLASSFITNTNSNTNSNSYSEITTSVSSQMINFYVTNNTNKRIVIDVCKPNNCNYTTLSSGVDAGKKRRFTAEKGSCIKVYRGGNLGSVDYEGQNITVN